VSIAISAIVLAAGKSSRMGIDNKLLLEFNGKAMVSHVIDQLVLSNVHQIIVVLGNEAEQVRKSITQNVEFIDNADYNYGLSTSLIAGINALPPDCEGVMICLGDMPYITADNYNMLIENYQEDKIIAPTMDGKVGNPIIFSNSYFEKLLKLSGDKGAKKIMKEYPEHVIEVDVGSTAIFNDIDTPDAYYETLKEI